MAPTVRRYVEEHKDEVKQVYRHMPLSQHQYALIAAEAVEAAGEQGKFWELEERIFANQSQLSPAFLQQTAASIGLDMKRFNAALDGHTYALRIKDDLDEAQRRGINSTPTFFVNGRQYRGAPTYEQLDAAVKEAQQRLQQ